MKNERKTRDYAAFNGIEDRTVASESETHLLIVRAQDGDKSAFDELAKVHADRVASLLRRRLGPRFAHKVEISDLVQETFLRAWQAIGSFTWQGEAAFFAWLVRIATTVFRMELRSLRTKKRDVKREVSLNCPVPAPGGGVGELVDLIRMSGASPSRALRRDERFRRLQFAMSKLSPDHRKVIILAHIQGLHTGEIARHMGRSPEAVSLLLYRGLMKLKAYFGSTDSFHLPDRRLEDEGNGT